MRNLELVRFYSMRRRINNTPLHSVAWSLLLAKEAVRPNYCSTSNRGMLPSGRDVALYKMNKTEAAQAHLPKNNLQCYKHLQTLSGLIRMGPDGKRSRMQSQCILQKTWCSYILCKNQCFVHMLKVLDPRYVLPSCKYFSKVALPQLYNTTNQSITRQLEGVSFK